MIEKKTLLVFMQKILENGPKEKAEHSLRELERILREQGASDDMIALVNQTTLDVPEAMETAKSLPLTEENLKIAHQRADRRREWETAMTYHGRC